VARRPSGGTRLTRLHPETLAAAGTILPVFCPTDPHRAAQTRITLNSQSAESPADQGEGDSDESCRTVPDESHPAENRKVGGSIPSLATRALCVGLVNGESTAAGAAERFIRPT
jgi:hypothetical protein